MVLRIFPQISISFQTRSKEALFEFGLRDHWLVGRKLEPDNQAPRLLIRLIFAHDDEAYQTTKALCLGFRDSAVLSSVRSSHSPLNFALTADQVDRNSH